MRNWNIAFALSLALLGCEAQDPEPRFAKKKPEPEQVLPTQAAQAVKPAAPNSPPMRPLLRSPSSPDPMGGKFELKAALEGMPKSGKLNAKIETSLGSLDCTLFDDKAPLTVANFVGLARGLRPFWDGNAGAWVKRPLYDGTTFHRVIEGFMIQGGDHMGNGTGDVGYNLVDELHPSLKHDRAGLLCMANKGPNTNGGQFFITDAPAPHLTQMGTYSIFGECKPVDVVHKIARTPKVGERPDPPVTIKKVTITRG